VVKHLPAEFAPLGGARFERAGTVAVSLNFRAKLLDHLAIRRAASTA
jgi:hypothetical protein